MRVSTITIDVWVKKCCPCEKAGNRGEPWIFNSAKVIEWRQRQLLLKVKKKLEESELWAETLLFCFHEALGALQK